MQPPSNRVGARAARARSPRCMSLLPRAVILGRFRSRAVPRAGPREVAMSTPFDAFSDLRLDDARALLGAAEQLLELGLERARAATGNGARIDEHQVTTERVAYAATEGRAARALVELAARIAGAGA